MQAYWVRLLRARERRCLGMRRVKVWGGGSEAKMERRGRRSFHDGGVVEVD